MEVSHPILLSLVMEKPDSGATYKWFWIKTKLTFNILLTWFPIKLCPWYACCCIFFVVRTLSSAFKHGTSDLWYFVVVFNCSYSAVCKQSVFTQRWYIAVIYITPQFNKLQKNVLIKTFHYITIFNSNNIQENWQSS